ncbi:MAG: hypothetical protein OXP11_04025, partial [Gammaproteobacteria bacterium]|nr:hypothetical protein [Gammaproteobacteria bacterium]
MSENLQFVLEYVHAAWSCSPDLADDGAPLDEAKAAAVVETLEELRIKALLFGQLYAIAGVGSSKNVRRGDLIILARMLHELPNFREPEPLRHV